MWSVTFTAVEFIAPILTMVPAVTHQVCGNAITGVMASKIIVAPTLT